MDTQLKNIMDNKYFEALIKPHITDTDIEFTFNVVVKNCNELIVKNIIFEEAKK
jgi:hypothetical protein